MKDDLVWILKWIRRHAFQPLFWIGPFVTLVYSNLATQTNPVQYALETGPVHFRVGCLVVAVGFLISLVVELCRRLIRASIPRDVFYRKTAVAQLSDWKLDAHWLPFDGIVEICLAPNLLEPDNPPGENGWSFGDCKLKRLGKFDRTPSLATHYESTWKKTVDPEKLKRDGTKYVLVNKPTSETDEHFIRLELRETKWSHIQSFLDQIKPEHEGRKTLFATADPEYREDTKPRMDFTISRVPHSLCLHGVVVTTDKKVLALQRPGPERTDYHPFAWSFSFEEQLADKDFTNENGEVDIKAWLIRSVRQE